MHKISLLSAPVSRRQMGVVRAAGGRVDGRARLGFAMGGRGGSGGAALTARWSQCVRGCRRARSCVAPSLPLAHNYYRISYWIMGTLISHESKEDQV